MPPLVQVALSIGRIQTANASEALEAVCGGRMLAGS
jgi:hypothetical protein